MDKQKQILEIADVIAKYISSRDFEVKFITNPKSKAFHFSHTAGVAEDLYNAGYRKIHENVVVLTRDEYKKLESLANDKCHYDCHLIDYPDFESERLVRDTTRKETAEKFAEMLKEKLSEWLDDNEDLNFKIDKGIAIIELIGVETLEGEVIEEGLIDEICKKITEVE